MKVHVKVFPIAGVNDQSQKIEILLGEGSLSEALMHLQERLCPGSNPGKLEKLMFLHNGRYLDRHKDAVFQDGDELWLLPLLSGG